MKLKVLAVDDNHSKLTQLIIELEKSAGLNEDAPAESRLVEIVPEEFQIVDGIEKEQVVEKVLNFDAAIVDYQLGSEANVDFTGVDVIDEVLRRHRHFPVFLLTASNFLFILCKAYTELFGGFYMSLIKCDKCGELFSDSYRKCPFCAEDEEYYNGGNFPFSYNVTNKEKEQKIKEDKIPYDIWADRGFLTLCEGAKVNYTDVTN